MSLLSQLAKELGTTPDELSANLRGSDESLQPNNVIVKPDGTITYDFAGHVHARGLDIDAGTAPNPGNASRVRWLKTTTGAVVAELLAYDDGFQETLQVYAHAESELASRIEAYSIRDSNSHQSAIILNQDDNTDGQTYARFRVQGKSGTLYDKILIDDIGSSEWMKLIASSALRLYFAEVVCNIGPSINAAIGVNAIIRNGVGDYTLSHDAAPRGSLSPVTGNRQASGSPRLTYGIPVSNVQTRIIVEDQTATRKDGETVVMFAIG